MHLLYDSAEEINMLPILQILVVALTLVAFLVVLKKTGAAGILIISSYVILLIPDRFFIELLSNIYFDNELGKVTNIADWLESGMSLLVLASVVLLLVFFVLKIKKENRNERICPDETKSLSSQNT
jgi:hypothetical protein